MGRVLVVDDDRRFANRVGRHLRAAGHEVTTAYSSRAALEQMRAQPPDLLVTEVMLEYVLAGSDMLHEMAKVAELRGVPVVVVTALTGAEGLHGRGGEEAVPVDAWLAKPVDMTQVVDVANRFVTPEPVSQS